MVKAHNAITSLISFYGDALQTAVTELAQLRARIAQLEQNEASAKQSHQQLVEELMKSNVALEAANAKATAAIEQVEAMDAAICPACRRAIHRTSI
jgi:chromosome segregation ATPase